MPRDKKFEGDMTAVGTMRQPPVCHPPHIDHLFEDRSLRFERLAPTNPVSSYIHFLAALTKAQHESAQNFKNEIGLIIEKKAKNDNTIPIINRDEWINQDIFLKITQDFLARASNISMPQAAKKAVERIKNSTALQLEIANNINKKQLAEDQLAEYIFMLASLQIVYGCAAHYSDPKKIKLSQYNQCPTCGGSHYASQIVNWPNAEGTRFCACLYCGTMWNFVRIKCTFCGQTGAIEYSEVADGPGSILVENCRHCGQYCKLTDSQKDPNLNVFADDIGSLAIDLLVKQEGRFTHGAFNPFLYGY